MLSSGIVFITLLLLGVPVALVIGAVSLGYVAISGLPLNVIPQRIVAGADSFLILAIPFYLLAGEFMNRGGVTKRVFQFASLAFGWIRGGLGHVVVAASMIFAGMSGSALAEAAGLGTVQIKAMEDEGWDKDFAAALVAAASTIGPIIPPSIPLVMYGVIAEESIGRLFLAGAIPGLVMGLSLMFSVFLMAKKEGLPAHPRPRVADIARSFLSALPSLLMPAFILGSIVLGIASPTEAGAIAVAYALVLGGLIHRELTFKKIVESLVVTAENTVAIMLIVAFANVASWILAVEGVGQALAEAITEITSNPLLILLGINILLLILGCFLESLSILIVFTPVLLPIIREVGIDPVHFGVVMVLNLMIGLLTPPFGMGLFVVSKIAERPIERIVRKTLIFMVALLVALAVVTYLPPVVLWLPRLLMG